MPALDVSLLEVSEITDVDDSLAEEEPEVLVLGLLGFVGVLALDPVTEQPDLATISAGQSTVSKSTLEEAD